MSFPSFIGSIGSNPDLLSEFASEPALDWKFRYALRNPNLAIWARAGRAGLSCWQQWAEPKTGTFVFVWGQPLIASDASFAATTEVARIERDDLPVAIWRLYRRHGTNAFALLEGGFSLIMRDPELKTTFLVVDKFGCEDICIRNLANRLMFASQPLLLADASSGMNPITTAFFLAQEGFVPTPFTLFDSVETVGRGRFLRVTESDRISVERQQYWTLRNSSETSTRRSAIEQFGSILSKAITCRQTARNGILLSGGVDSALLANLMKTNDTRDLIAVTGAVCGHVDSTVDMGAAKSLSLKLGLHHEAIWLDPSDDRLPAEWTECCDSWSSGTRITLPLFQRLARRLGQLMGNGYMAFSGQMADTLADNNYTSSSFGYTMRRMFFSSWFLSLLPILQEIAPRTGSRIARVCIHATQTIAGPRLACMVESVLNGMCGYREFYAGRVFGFGEMPGLAPSYFPALTRDGFARVADWYATTFVAPIVSRVKPNSFYADMAELSMDMCMLHLDTRPIFHIFRLGGGNIQLPFLDARAARFFAFLPYSARAFYQKPKYVIRAQFKKYGFAPPMSAHPKASKRGVRKVESNQCTSFECALLNGSLSAWFRELLKAPTALDCAPGIFELVNESYVERQRRDFLRGEPGVDCKFISRFAALEVWARALRQRSGRVQHAGMST